MTITPDYLAGIEKKYGLPAGVLNAMMAQESGGNPNAVSGAGAQGLFQFMPATAQELGIDPMVPEQAADGAGRYLKQNLDQFGGKLDLALAAYNSGPGAVQKYNGIPPFAETQAYVPAIMKRMGQPVAAGAQVTMPVPAPQPDLAAAMLPDAPQAQPPVSDLSDIPDQELVAFHQGNLAGVSDAALMKIYQVRHAAPVNPVTTQAPPSEPGFLDTIGQAAMTGLSKNIEATTQAGQLIAGQQPAPAAPLPPSPVNNLINAPYDFPSVPDSNTLKKVGAKTAYGLGESAPEMAGAIVGGLAGTAAVGGPEDPLAVLTAPVGAGVGGGAVSLAKSIAPFYAEELKKNPGNPDAAFEQAIKKAEISGAGTAASFALFGVAPFKNAVKDILLQSMAVQPAVGIAENAAQNVMDSKPAMENAGQTYLNSASGTIVPLGAHAATKAIASRIGGRAASETPAPAVQPNPIEPPATPAGPEPATIKTPLESPTIEPPRPAPEAPPQPVAQPQGAPKPQPAPETPAAPEPPAAAPEAPAPVKPVAPESRLTTPNNSMEITARPEVVDLGSLRTSDMPDYPADRQPRDRTSKRSEAQIQEIVKNFDPQRLGESRTTDQGAPIIGPEQQNFVESGNGRVMALRRAYENPDLAQRYKEALSKAGYDISGMEKPVLVRRRTTALDRAGLSKFVEDSNRNIGMAQNETEVAAQDARRMTPETIALYRGGAMTNEANQQFRNRFMKEIVGSEAEAAGLRDQRGNLSQAGERRIRAAMFQYAYKDPNAVENFFTSSEPDLKSIGDVMQDVAPNFAAARANIESHKLGEGYDISKNLTDALDIIRRARDGGDSIATQMNQRGMFDGGEINPITERLVRGLYNSDLSRVASKKAIDNFLRGYADKVKNFEPGQGDVFGESKLPTPERILDNLLKARDTRETAPGQGTLTGTQAPSVKPKRRAAAEAEASRPLPVSEAALSDEEPTLDFSTKPAEKPKGARPYGSKSERDYYFTNRQSLFRSLFRDAGFDPEKIASNPQAQLRIAKEHFQKKYNIPVTVEKGLQNPLAVDQLLDLYRNLQGMAAVLQIPESAMGLKLMAENKVTGQDEPGFIRLKLTKEKPHLGAFNGKTRELMMPPRTNSFAHEWGHGLDYLVLNKLDPEGAFRGFSSKVKQAKGEFEPGTIEEGFLNLVQHIYGDGALDILKLAKLEQEMAGIRSGMSNAKTKPETRIKLQAKEKQIAAQLAEIKKKHSKYFQEAKSIPAADDYWYRPTEMLARSFEAYVAHRIQLEGGATEGVTMDPEAYHSADLANFAKSYPQADERIRIFQAWHDLMGKIREKDILGAADKPIASMPARDLDMLDPSRITRLTNDPEAVRGFINKIRNLAANEIYERDVKKSMIAEAARQPKDLMSLVTKTRRAQKMGVSSVAEALHFFERQYPQAGKQIGDISDLVTDRPGVSKAVGQTFLEQTEMDATRFHNELSRIFIKFSLENMSADQNDMLRDLLLGKKTEAPDNMVQAAATIRNNIYKELWYYARKAGMDVGYIENTGYVNREMNHAQIMTDGEGFLKSANEGYKLVFENEHGPVDSVDMEKFLATVRTINTRRKIQGQEAPFGKSHEGMQALRQALRKINEIGKAVASGKIGQDEADPKIAKLNEQIQEILDSGLYDEVRGEYADIRANDWLTRINGEEFYDFDRTSPNDDFTKHRSLPPEFDDIMKKYYVTGVRDLVTSYIRKAVTRSNYIKRFEPKGGKDINARLAELATLGVDPRDIGSIKELVAHITGRNGKSAVAKAAAPLLSKFHTVMTVTMLARSFLSQVSEPLTSGLQSGSVRVGAESLLDTFKSIAGEATMQDWHDLADHVGFVGSSMTQQHLANQVSGDFVAAKSDQRVIANFMQYSGIDGYTQHSRIGVLASGNKFIRRLVRDATGESQRAKDLAIDELARLGVPRERVADYASWLKDIGDKIPTIENMDSNMGQFHKTVLQRFMDRSIQAARRDKRPMPVSSPYGRMIYSITGFLYSYWENVTKAIVKRGIEINQKYGAKEAAKYWTLHVTAPLAVLMAGHTLIFALRSWLYNHRRWDEWEKDGSLVEKMLMGGASQLGGLGPLDPVWNALQGMRYERDLTAVLAGAHLGFELQQLQRIIKAFPPYNTSHTNTPEYSGIKGAYLGFVAPAINYALSATPLGPVAGFLAGLGMQVASSNAASDQIAQWLVGAPGQKDEDSSSMKMKGMDLGGNMKMKLK